MNTSDKAFEELCKKEYGDDYPVLCGKLDILFVWNAAIDEAVKAIENKKCEADGYHACSQQDVFIDKIKELKD